MDHFTVSLPMSTEDDPPHRITLREEWLKDGKPHRIGGPAVIYRDAATGSINRQEWWTDGTRTSVALAAGEPADDPGWTLATAFKAALARLGESLGVRDTTPPPSKPLTPAL